MNNLIIFLIIFICFFGGYQTTTDENYYSIQLLQLGDKFIYVSKGYQANWYRAHDHCASYGLKLFSITTPEQNFLIEEFLRNYTPKMDSVWTAGTDLGQEGVWRWSSTGEKFSYANWTKQNPDNYMYANGCEFENCLEVGFENDAPSMYWNDAQCSKMKSFICEI